MAPRRQSRHRQREEAAGGDGNGPEPVQPGLAGRPGGPGARAVGPVAAELHRGAGLAASPWLAIGRPGAGIARAPGGPLAGAAGLLAEESALGPVHGLRPRLCAVLALLEPPGAALELRRRGATLLRRRASELICFWPNPYMAPLVKSAHPEHSGFS